MHPTLAEEWLLRLSLSTATQHLGTLMRSTQRSFVIQGFAERKLGLISDVIAYCKSFHNAAVRRARLAAATVPSKVCLSSLLWVQPTVGCTKARFYKQPCYMFLGAFLNTEFVGQFWAVHTVTPQCPYSLA